MVSVAIPAASLKTSADHVGAKSANDSHHVAQGHIVAVPHLEGLFRRLGESKIGNPGEALVHPVIAVGCEQLQSANNPELIQ